jgi:predicted kinase
MPSDPPRVVLVVGLPGSGKSKYLRDLGVNAISSDDTRLQLIDNEEDQSIHPQVFATMRYLLDLRLALRRPVTYIDATNLTRRDRRAFLDLARKHGASAEALFFDVPVAICKAQNALRERTVPENVIDLMAARLVPPSLSEGFSRVDVVRCASHLPETPNSPSAD